MRRESEPMISGLFFDELTHGMIWGAGIYLVAHIIVWAYRGFEIVR